MNNNFIKRIKNKKGLILLIFGAVLGVILIFSDTSGASEKTEKIEHTVNIEEYAENLEQRLEALVDKISGVSDVNIMITLESGNEYIYASDDSELSQKHVVVNDGLVYVTENLPKIKGVAIVCRGGNDEVLQTKITELTCSVLGIYSTMVYVTE